MTFRADDLFLAVASSSTSVHIFKLDKPMIAAGAKSTTSSGSASFNAEEQTVSPQNSEGVGLTPENSKLRFDEQRSFAIFRIPDHDGSGRASAVDVRCPQSSIVGPQVGFRGK